MKTPHTICLLSLVTLLSTMLSGCVHHGATTASPLKENVPVKAATYNIKHGLGMDGRIDLERTAVVLAALDADVIALQEVDEGARRSGGIDQAGWFGERLGMHAAFGAFMDFQDGRYGLAILSRHPIVSHDSWRLPDGNEPRVALAARIAPPGEPEYTVIAVHFDWVQDDGFRFEQASETIDRIKTLETPWIVLGDFNDTPGSRTMDGFHAIGTEAVKAGAQTGTFPSVEPRTEIDFILAGPAGSWRVGEASVIDERIASDHRPVTATIHPN